MASSGREAGVLLSDPSLLCSSGWRVVLVGDGVPYTNCFASPRSTDTMIAASKVSLKTMKNIGIEKMFLPIVSDKEVKFHWGDGEVGVLL